GDVPHPEAAVDVLVVDVIEERVGVAIRVEAQREARVAETAAHHRAALLVFLVAGPLHAVGVAGAALEEARKVETVAPVAERALVRQPVAPSVVRTGGDG